MAAFLGEIGMNESLKAPVTATECAVQEAALVVDWLTATDAMFIVQSILELAQNFVPADQSLCI